MTIETKALSLEMAKKIANAVEQKAIENTLKIAIAILDAHGNLKYFYRMDGNNFVSIRMSQLKAMTSASIPISTKSLAERNKNMDNNPYASVPGIVLLEGGIPIITKDGQHIGAIGVSGANPELDGICAQAGLDAIAEEL
jgi:glc operon protein GlcG